MRLQDRQCLATRAEALLRAIHLNKEGAEVGLRIGYVWNETKNAFEFFVNSWEGQVLRQHETYETVHEMVRAEQQAMLIAQVEQAERDAGWDATP